MGISFWRSLAVFLALSGCAHKTVSPSATSGESAEARLSYQKAEAALKARDSERAATQYRKIRSRFPGTRFARLSAYRLGSLAYSRKDFASAATLFEEMLRSAPNGSSEGIEEFRLDATYNLAACQFQQKHFDRAYATLAGIDPAPLGPKDVRRAEMIYSLVERVSRHIGDRPGLVMALAGHSDLAIVPSAKEQLLQEFDQELALIPDADLLVAMLEGRPFGRSRPISIVQNPSARLKIQNRVEEISGRRVAETDPLLTEGTTPDASSSSDLPRVIRAGSGNIGILLPLTGKAGALGHRLLDTLLLSSGLFDSKSTSKLKIFVEDTGSSDKVAEAAVERLVNTENLTALIGPVAWKEAVAVARKSQSLEVVNLSLATREGVNELGDFIFQNALIPRVQVEDLAEFCVTQKGYKRFAILAASDALGMEMANRFWDAIKKRGGEIVSLENYAPEDTDFQEPIQKMVGLFNIEKFRKTELDKIAEFQKEAKLKNPKSRERKFRLQPIIDFDALFIPDVPKVVSQIVPTLTYFDVQGPALLGVADWGLGQIYRRIGKAAVGSYFPVAIHPETRNPGQYTFLNLYKEAFGTLPDLLAAQAFEAMDMVLKGLQKSGGTSASGLAQALSGLQGSEGVLGVYGVDSKRVVSRKLPVFSVDASGALIEVSRTIQ